MKRYAIVRVDKLKFCPSDIEGIDDKLVCSKTKDGESKVCIYRYGDTKEQLCSKVEQVIRRKINQGKMKIVSKGFCVSVQSLAREIIEFMGVK